MAPTRRDYLKTVGMASSAGFVAGCIGGGGLGLGGSLKEVGVAIAPSGVWVMVMNYLEENGIVAEHMEEEGYTASITQTWEEVPLFASGQADIVASMGSMAAARLGPQREMHLTANGLLRTQDTGWLVNKGGDYDPATTGGREASIEKIIEDQAVVGIGSWSAGYVPVDRMFVQEMYGYDLSEDGDFNVVTADFAALANLLDQGDIDVAVTAPTLGVPQLMPPDPTMVALFWTPKALEEQGFLQTNLPLGSFIATNELADNDPGAITAFLRVMEEGHRWVNSSNLDELFEDEDNIRLVGANSAEEAKFMLDWSFNFYDVSGFPVDVTLTSGYVDSEIRALNQVADLGLIPNNWADYLTFREVSI